MEETRRYRERQRETERKRQRQRKRWSFCSQPSATSKLPPPELEALEAKSSSPSLFGLQILSLSAIHQFNRSAMSVLLLRWSNIVYSNDFYSHIKCECNPVCALTALWSSITKNPDIGTGPLGLPSACLLASLTHSPAPLTHCLIHKKVFDQMAIFSVFFSFLDHSVDYTKID